MVSLLFRYLKAILERRAMERDPVAFARSLGVRVGSGVRIWGVSRGMFGSEPWLVTVGDNVYITAEVQFITHDGGTLPLRKIIPDLEWTAPITVKNDVFIGFRSTIMPGVTIGESCIIGAGSIVTKSVPPNSVAAGNPARVIKRTEEYLAQLQRKSLRCGHLKGDEKAKVLKEHFGITHA